MAGPVPAILRGTVLVEMAGSSPAMTIGTLPVFDDWKATGFRRLERYRSSGLMSRTAPTNPASSARSHLRCTRFVEGGCLPRHAPGRRSTIGRIGRGTNPPPQFGQTLARTELGAVRAERAFIAADPGINRVRRKVLVAILTVGPQLQHVAIQSLTAVHARPLPLRRSSSAKSSRGRARGTAPRAASGYDAPGRQSRDAASG